MAGNKALPRFSGACLMAALGLVLGNFLLYDSSAALAAALSSRFGSSWFFEDLLASSLSPLGALLGLVFGFVLIDLPRLSLRQADHDNFAEAALYLRRDKLLQQAIFRLLGAQCAAGGRPNLLQRDFLLQLIAKLQLTAEAEADPAAADFSSSSSSSSYSSSSSSFAADETVDSSSSSAATGSFLPQKTDDQEILRQITVWLAEGSACISGHGDRSALTSALLYCNSVCQTQHLPSLRPWLSRRLADLALCSVQLSPSAEALFGELCARLNLYAADSGSMLHLKMEQRSERAWTAREQYLASAWWNFVLQEESAEPSAAADSGFADWRYAWGWQTFGAGGFGADGSDGANQAGAGERGSSAGGSSLNELGLSEAMQILGVDALTSDAEVKKSYRRLMFKYHPDHQSGRSAAARARAQEQALLIRLAYELICEARGIRA